MEQAVDFTNVHDDHLMISLGMRQPHYYDPIYEKRTNDEKRQLRKLRCKNKGKIKINIFQILRIQKSAINTRFLKFFHTSMQSQRKEMTRIL